MNEDFENPDGPVFPDYKDSVLNLSCSILQHFGITPEHETLPAADELLSKNFKHIVVIVISGLGMNILEQHLLYKDFLRRNLVNDYSSVFPTTTTASTVSFLSGKSPCEHGCLNHDFNFDQETIIEKINKTEKAKAFSVLSYGSEAHSDLYDWVETIRKTCKTDQKTFTYAFWDQLDKALHTKGTKSNDIEKLIRELNVKITYLCEETPKTLFFITADHGHTDIRNDFIVENYPELGNMLKCEPVITSRTISFSVKPEFLEKFKLDFNANFGNSYLLFSKNELTEKELLGTGEPIKNLNENADYFAIAFKDKNLLWNQNSTQVKSEHGGLSKNELRIPLISYANKPRKIGLFIYYGFIAALIIYLIIALF